jgi:nucleotide-binding universal stress UspA family protein
MFNTLLVPLDGSAEAGQVLPIDSRIACHSGGTLLLLRVIDPINDVRMFTTELSGLVPDATMEPDLLDAVVYLAHLATSPDLKELKLSLGIVSGTAASCILDIAQEQQTNVIVMRSHGYTGAKRWMMGSVAQKVARHSPVPVLIVRDGGSIPSGPYPDRTRSLRPVKALVALDGSARAEATLVPLAHLLGAFTAPARGIVHLIRAVPLPPVGYGEDHHSRVSSSACDICPWLKPGASHPHEWAFLFHRGLLVALHSQVFIASTGLDSPEPQGTSLLTHWRAWFSLPGIRQLYDTHSIAY